MRLPDWRCRGAVRVDGANGRQSRARSRRMRCRLALEPLEDRTLLTVQPLTWADPSFAGLSAFGMSARPSMSADGQLVVFASDADNLVPNDTNGTTDVFVYSRATNEVRLISAALDATAAGRCSQYCAAVISPDGRYVAFESSSSNPLVTGVVGDQLYLRDLQTGTTALVTWNSAGTGGAAAAVYDVAFTGDSQHLVFQSAANTSQDGSRNLTNDPVTSGRHNLFLRNLTTSQTVLVSVDQFGTGVGITGSDHPRSFSASRDGRFVAFLSDQGSYVGNDPNSTDDVFVRDTVVGTTELISVDRFGTLSVGNSGGAAPSMSADGRYVAFVSEGANLTTVNPSGSRLAYVRDRRTNTTTAISVRPDGTVPSYSVAREPMMSADGRTVAFSASADLLPLDTNGKRDVYAYDQVARHLALVSVNATGANGGNADAGTDFFGSPRPQVVSADGRYVYFRSGASDLVSGVTPAHQNLYRHDLLTQQTQLVTVDATGAGSGNTDSDTAAVSDDGRYVAFQSFASNLVSGDTNHRQDIFVRDLTVGSTLLASRRTTLLPAVVFASNGGSLEATTPDGRYVVITSLDGVRTADAFPSDYRPDIDAGYATHVLVRDTQTGQVTFVDLNPAGTRAVGGDNPQISSDGRYVTFESTADLDAAHANNGSRQVFVRDRQTGTTTMVSRSTTGGPANGSIDWQAPITISPDGRYVVWGSSATNLVADMADDSGGWPGNLFLYDRVTDTVKLVSHAPGQPARSGNGGSVTPVFSPDGTKVAFVSRATNLVSGLSDTNNEYDLFVYDISTGDVTCASVSPAGTATGNGRSAYPPDLDATRYGFSANGRYLFFASAAGNLVGVDTNNRLDTFRRDLVNNSTVLVSVNATGTASGNGDSSRLSISSDGQRVAFMSYGDNLVAGFTPGNQNSDADVYVHDFGTGQTVLVSAAIGSGTAGGDGHSFSPIISPDGRYVSFLSTSTNLAPGFVDSNGASKPDLFLHDLTTGQTGLVTSNEAGTAGGSGDFVFNQPDTRRFSTGNTLYFNSRMPDIAPADRNGTGDVFSFTPAGAGVISGKVFGDTDASGTFNGSEAGLPYWTVYLDTDHNGRLNAGEPYVLTDANGNYCFMNLAAGTYTVTVVPQADHVQTAPNAPATHSVSLATSVDNRTGIDFAETVARPDLEVTSVWAPLAATVGGTLAVSWTVQNSGSPVAGDWQDAIYLSQSTTLGPDAILLETVPHTGGLAASGSYTGAATVSIPGIQPGNYHILIQTDRRNQVSTDVDRANNVRARSSSTSMDVPTLTLGQDYTADAFDAVGQAFYYRVVVPNDSGSMMVRLTSAAATGQTSLYLRRGVLPTPWDYDQRAIGAGQPNQALSNPTTGAGTYYVLVRGESGLAATSSFVVRAELADHLTLLGSTPASGGNTGRVTVEITGLNLTPTTAVRLAHAAVTINAQAIDYRDASRLYATFDLNGAAVGAYDVELRDGAATATAAGAFHVVTGVTGTVAVNLVTPQFIRYDRENVIILEYQNPTTNDLVAPLLEVTSTKALFRQPGTPYFLRPAVQVLATAPDGPAGILRPGQTGRVVLPILSNTTVAHDAIPVQVNVLASNQTVDWNAIKDNLRPATIQPDAWDVIWSNFVGMVGPTNTSYNARLAQAATYLGALGVSTRDVDRLYTFLIAQANAALTAPALDSAVDASVAAPGMPLSFTRTYLGSISGRYRLGILGRGWASPWEASLTAASGLVSINVGGGVRYFALQRDGLYHGGVGESATLTQSGGTFTLAEATGERWTFRGDGKLDHAESANGNRITLGYDGSGRLTTLTHSNGQVLTLTYNAQGRVAAITDGVGRSTTYTYDNGGTGEHLVSVTDSQGTTQYQYAVGGPAATEHALTQITSRDGSNRFYSYDSMGRLAGTSRDGDAEQVTYSYLGDGQVRYTDALDHRSTVWFNEGGLIDQVRDANGNVTAYDYDAAHRLVHTVNAAGGQYFYSYDTRGNVTHIVDPLGQVVSLQYTGGAYDRLEQITDARGDSTRYGYDARGNLRSITYPGGGQETFQYDPLGNLTESVNRRGHATAYTTDDRGRTTRIDFADGTSQTFTYDPFDNLTSVTDSTGTTTLEYADATTDPARGRLTRITYPTGRYLVFTYDGGGRRTMSVDQDGFAVRYEYDALGRLSQLTDDAPTPNLIVRYTYDTAGRLIRKDNGNGTYTTYDYDPAGQLQSIQNRQADATLNSWVDYTYDSLGRRVTSTDDVGMTTYRYDDVGQLTKVTLPGGRTIEYTYDATGNRVRVDDSQGGTTSYSVDSENRITQVGTVVYTYDADGNLHTITDAGGTTTYTFNDIDQLTGISGPGGTSSFEYSALGMRTAAIRNGTRTEYLIDPAGLGNVVGDYRSGSSAVTNYVHGYGLVSQFGPGGTGYYDFDGVGNTIGITAAAQTYVNRYHYLPFGETTAVTATLANPFTFVGQFGVADATDDLAYMRLRYYSSAIGQFVSDDPLMYGGNDSNIRRYSANNPVSKIDPAGARAIGSFNEGDATSALLWAGVGLVGAVFLIGGGGVVGGALLTGYIGAQAAWWAGATVGSLVFLAIGTPAFGAESNADGGYNPNSAPPSLPGDPAQSATVDNRTSNDPNDLIGPAGVGPEHHVRPTGTWAYTIDFENRATASAPAQEVRVIHQLDSDLDWSTFELGSFGFGAQVLTIPAGLQRYQTSVAYHNADGSPLRVDVSFDFNQETGRLTVTFDSVDPATGTFPLDVFAGFLPPDDASNRGKGFVQYTVAPKATLPSGATVDQQATVVFDANPPIDTPVFTNTIDATAPTSGVDALPTFSPKSFTVTWAGVDAHSGVASYDVYVSDNNEPYSLWLDDTPLTAAQYTSTADGHTYRFYSVARDRAGNVEPSPGFAQASTTVVFPADHLGIVAPSTAPGGFFTATVQALSPTGLVDVFFQGSLALGLNAAPAGGTLSGVTVQTAQNGVATFHARLGVAGAYPLFASSTGDLRTTTATITSTAVAAPVARFSITGVPVNTPAGQAFDVTVRALNANNQAVPSYVGTVRFTSTDPQAALPADYTFQAGDNGVKTFTITLKTAGARTVTVADTAAGSLKGTSISSTVNPRAATTLGVTSAASTVQGAPLSVVVTARDPYGNRATGYRGVVRFTSSDGSATLPANYLFTATDNGMHSFSVTLRTQGAQLVTATDTVTATLTGTRANVQVVSAATRFTLTALPRTRAAGQAFSVTVRAVNAAGIVIPGYRGTVRFTSTDPQAVLPADYTFQAGDNGVKTFTFTLKTAGARAITATDVALPAVKATSTACTVMPLTTVSGLRISGLPTDVLANVTRNITVVAVDQYGNRVAGYRGQVRFTSSDGSAMLPPNYRFTATDAGAHVFPVQLRTVGSGSLTVTDTSTGSLTTTQNNLNVGTLNVAVAGPSSAVRGQPLTYTLSASESNLSGSTPFTFRIDWNNDGIIDQTVIGPTGTQVSRINPVAGAMTLRVTAVDASGNSARTAPFSVNVLGVSMQTDPMDNTRTALVIGGTTGNDTIVITPTNTAGTQVMVTFHGVVVAGGPFTPTGHILVYGQGGKDSIQVASTSSGAQVARVAIPAVLFAGSGGSTVSTAGSSADNVLVGSTGNDTLTGGSGRDLLIGGVGADVLRGGGGENILVGGSTTQGMNVVALLTLMQEWSRTDRPFPARVNALYGSTPGGRNDPFYLNATTVQQEQAIDQLLGSDGLDWWFFSLGGTGPDHVHGVMVDAVTTFRRP